MPMLVPRHISGGGMVKRIELWSVGSDEEPVSARAVESIDNADAEKLLEDLLVSSPQMLQEGLSLVGRQVPCEGGYLDLLGIDRDGRITIFELKRGTLTRDAVAQVLDYASDLASFDAERLAKLIEDNSGRLGIEKIDDFLDWYTQEYPDASDALSEIPRMVLVGLGVDDRARRIVGFLSEAGISLELLTFHAFRADGKLLFARQVEVTAPSRQPRDTAASITREGNREILHAKAAELGLKEFLEEVRTFLEAKLDAYCWPGKTAYSFSLQEKTEQGRPTLRAYMALYVPSGPPPHLLLVFAQRAVDAAGSAVDSFCQAVPEAIRGRASYSALEAQLRPETWDRVAPALGPLLDAVVAGWKQASSREEAGSP
jgi:hypothetical protein